MQASQKFAINSFFLYCIEFTDSHMLNKPSIFDMTNLDNVA